MLSVVRGTVSCLTPVGGVMRDWEAGGGGGGCEGERGTSGIDEGE